MKAPDAMTAGQINTELDKLDAQSSKLNDALIAAGRGSELPSETLRKTDALSLRWIANIERAQALRREIYRRMGGDYRRMGKGIKPIKNPSSRTHYKTMRGGKIVYRKRPKKRKASATRKALPRYDHTTGERITAKKLATKRNPSRAALKYESGIRLARAALSAAYTAKRSKNPRLLQAKISYAQGIVEALHKVGVINTPLARTYLEALRDILK
jgi:hypothetical protein